MAATLRRQYSTTDSTSRGPAAVVICTVFTSFAFIIVGLRLFTRFIFVRSVGAEDWLVTAALVSSIVLTVLISEEVRYGMGRHFITLSPTEYTTSLKPFYVSILFYNLGLALVKISIILQFLRIFIGPTIRRVCWTLLGIVITWIIFATFSQIFMCTPVAYFWDKRLNGTCINSMVLWFFNASFNIVTDLALLITPMPVLKSLQIPKRQKYGLMIIFAIGAFECVTSILRLHSLYIISVSTDITWDNVGAATWSSVEVNVGIICACLPMLKPFVKRFAPKLLGSTMSGTASGARRGSSVWPYASNRGTVLSSTPGDRTKGYPLEDGVKSYQSDVFGMHKLESKSSESQAEEGHIKVVKVFEVQHHGHEADSPGSSEFNLFTGANGREI